MSSVLDNVLEMLPGEDKTTKIIVLVLILIVVAVVAWYVYTNYIKKETTS